VSLIHESAAWRPTIGRPGALVLLLALFVTMLNPRPAAAIGGVACRSQDNHVYFIIRGTVSSVGTQITSVALTSGNSSLCTESPPSDGVLTALAVGVLGQGGSSILLPNRMRTTVLSGFTNNSVTCANFVSSAAGGMGQLTLPDGSTVSADPAFATVPLVDVHSADSGVGTIATAVPAAADVGTGTVSDPTLMRSVPSGTCMGAAMVFPSTQPAACNASPTFVQSSPSLGEQDCQTATLDDTNNSTVGNLAGGSNPHTVGNTQTTRDGFLLQGNCSSSPSTCQLIVFVAQQDGAAGFGAGAAGFKVAATGRNFATDQAGTNDSFNDTPTPTRTRTPTRTPTETPTRTATRTPTDTPTETPTPTQTPTRTATPTPSQTLTPSQTPTTTQTRTVTQSPTVTPTRTPTRTPTATATSRQRENCNDGIDNDGDKLIDCKDPDCAPCKIPSPAMTPPVLIAVAAALAAAGLLHLQRRKRT